MAEGLSDLEVCGRANPFHAIENTRDPVGEVPERESQYENFEDRDGEHCGQEPMLGHLSPIVGLPDSAVNVHNRIRL